jgi:hypothetical protein
MNEHDDQAPDEMEEETGASQAEEVTAEAGETGAAAADTAADLADSEQAAEDDSAATPAPTGVYEGEEPKGRSTGLIVLLVTVFVLLAVGIGAFGYLFYIDQQNRENLISTADAHLVAAGAAIDEIDAGWAEFAAASSDDASEAFASGMASTTQSIETARSEVEMAEAAVEQLPESTFRTEFLSAVALTRETLDAYEQLFTGMGDTMQISATLGSLGDQMDDARTLLNEAVEDIDESRYSDGEEKAVRAKKSYETVAARYRELAAEHPASEAEKLAAIADKNATQAGYAIDMAEAGRRGRVTEFNELVEKYAAVNEEIRALPLPSWAVDVTLLTAESTELLELAGAKRDEAIAAYDRAFEAYEAGEY